MAPEQVLSGYDSEDVVDDEFEGLEFQKLLYDFLDVSGEEKEMMQDQLMDLWNSFKGNRVLADSQIPQAFEEFSKIHAEELISSRALLWSWKAYMIVHKHCGLIDTSTLNKCNKLIDGCKNEGLNLEKK